MKHVFDLRSWQYRESKGEKLISVEGQIGRNMGHIQRSMPTVC